MCSLLAIDDFSNMYRDYYPKIYNYIFFRLLHKSDTEDIVGDIFLKVAENISAYNPNKASFGTWIFTIARNTLTDYLRKKRFHLSIDDEDSSISIPVEIDMDSEIILDGKLKSMQKALHRLDEKSREMIALKYWADMNNREISKFTGINESTVSTICLRAVARLRKELAGEFAGEFAGT
jgi:RNA polymerase sigma-70 factor (ECF subfamily)